MTGFISTHQLNFYKIFKRVSNWNAARYNRVFDEKLYSDLIKEEKLEWGIAVAHGDVLKQLDAIGDITFVIFGGMWKLGIDDITSISHLDEIKYTEPDKYSTFINMSNDAIEQFWKLSKLGGVPDYMMPKKYELWYELMQCICISNETKDEPDIKVASNIKANINKGKNYIPPDDCLANLLSKWRDKKYFPIITTQLSLLEND